MYESAELEGRGARALEWAIASRPLPGESECGDKATVIYGETGSLFAVVDGLGHGPDAAIAARAAIDGLSEHAGEPLPSLIERCHEALRHTRGAAIGLASLGGSQGTMSWVGIGTVQGRVVRGDDKAAAGASMMLTPGIAGHQIPKLRPARLKLRRGDLLLLATDGLREGFADSLDPTGSVHDIAHRTLEQYHRPQDDSLLLVVRLLVDRR
jgi:phosphoserine phosphatase RsbX